MKKSCRRATAVVVGALALGVVGQQSSQATYGPTTGGFVVGGADDNFGYLGKPVPCAFFDRSHPRDLGVFDQVTSGDNTYRWTQRFAAQLPAGFRTATLTIALREVFSDQSSSTVTVDGITRPLVASGDPFSLCGPAVVRTITLTGADAAVADDGVLHLVFREKGDEIALDWSAVTVTDASGTSYGGLGSPS